MLKRLLRSKALLSAAASLMAAHIKLVHKTSRIIREPADLETKAYAERPFIAALWHGQFLMVPAL